MPKFYNRPGVVKMHAYTDDNGLTLFRVDFGHKVLQFAAHITDFTLDTRIEGIPLGLSDYSTLPGYRETSISLNANVIEPPVYSTPAPPEEIEPKRKEIEP